MPKAERPLLILFLALLSLFFYARTITSFPSFVHAWTQSGYYALALGFIDNHYNFFLPNTPNLEPQFPGEQVPADPKGITSVDFPIHPYLVSLIMGVAGTTSPVVFRIYNLLWGMAGIFFLFLLTKKFTGSVLKSFFIAVFAATSPVYVYYQSGFLPSIPSFSAAIIGIYYFLGFRNPHEQKKIITGIIFLTLAALARTPFALLLFVAGCMRVLEWLRERKINRKEVLAFAGSFMLLLAYFLYNKHLAKTYGTMFLGQFMPAGSGEELADIFSRTLDGWQYHYLTQWHYIAMAAVLIGGIYFIMKKRPAGAPVLPLVGMGLACSGTAVLYVLLMARQYPDHDYYFLDSLFIPALLLLIALLAGIPTGTRSAGLIFACTALFFSVAFILHCKAVQEKRYTLQPWDRGQIVQNEFEKAGDLLDSAGISKNSKVLVLEAYDPYSSLILLERKGYIVTTTSRGNLERAFKKEFDFLVFPNELSVTDVILNYPEMLQQWEKTGDNGKISVYKKIKPAAPRSLHDFLGIPPSAVRVHEMLCSDTSQIYTLNDSVIFSPSFSRQAGKAGCTGKEKLLASVQIRTGEDAKDLQAVCLVKRNGETLDYSFFPLSKKQAGWQEEIHQFRLPENLLPDDEIIYYLWNAGGGNITYRNLDVIIYK